MTGRTAAFPLDGLTYVQGDRVDLKEAKGKHAVVLELWATWCGPCVSTTPHLTELYEKYKSHGVQIVGVSDESESAVRKFVTKMGSKMTYSVALDLLGITNKYRSTFGVRGIPHAFVIDKQGIVQYSGHPMDPSFETALRAAATQVVAAAAPKAEEVKAPSVDGKTVEEIGALSIKDLKAVLQSKHIDITGLLEKPEFVAKLMESLAVVNGVVVDK